jgi:hypothetical protein
MNKPNNDEWPVAWLWEKDAITDDDRKKFLSKSPFPTPAGYLIVRKKSTNEVINQLDIPAGFQPDRWISSWYGGSVYVKGARIFDLEKEDFQFERIFVDAKNPQ